MRKYFILTLIFLGLWLSNAAGQDQTASFKFDFGWPDLDPPDGFLKVVKEDIYTQAKGWGFSGSMHWGGYSGRFPHSPKLYYKHQDKISRDGLRISGSFVIDVPNGDYLVWYLEGDLGTYSLRPVWDHLAYSLTIEGNELHKSIPWDKELFRREYYRGIDNDYRRGEDVYARFVVPLMHDETAAVTVTDGQLTITGDGLNLTGLMVYPAAMKAEFEAEVARLRQHRREAFYSLVKVREPEEKGTAAPITPTEKARGYRLWPRHKMRVVSPGTQPSPDELGHTIKTIVAQDQTETVTFCVRPLIDLKEVTVSVTDLVSSGGDKIPAESINVRILYYRADYMRAHISYSGSVVRSHLPPFTKADLPADITKQFWLTFHTDRDTGPGVYAGKVMFKSANRPEAELAVKVKVLPFALREIYQDATFVMQSSLPARYTSQLGYDKFPGEFMPAMIDMFQHLKGLGLLPQFRGIKAKTFDYETPAQRIEFDPVSLDIFCQQVEAYAKIFPGVPLVVSCHHLIHRYYIPRKCGKTGWPLSEQSEATWKLLREYFVKFKNLRKEHPDWPPLYYVTGAEMSNGGRDHILYGRKFIELAKSVPGVRVIACPNGTFEARTFAPIVDVIAPNYAVPLTDKAFAGIPSEKTQLWIYQAFNRFSYGFYAAKVKATGSFKEFYNTANQRPYNSFDGIDLGVNCALPSPDGMISIPNIEEFSWGVTDFRYIKTLEQFINSANKSGRPQAVKAAKEAELFLAELFGGINPDLNYYMNQAGFWDYTVYDTYRWLAAEKIMNIQSELQK